MKSKSDALAFAWNRVLLQKVRLFGSISLLLISLWQLEMVFVGMSWPYGYNFAGFGSFGWELWQWHDFWYIVIVVAWLLKPIKRVDLVIFQSPPE